MKFCPQCGGTYEGGAGFCPDDGTVLEAAPPVEVGQVLDGQYQIEAFIARGGMGTLHRARHILLGDRVVIKTLRPEMRSNSEWLRRFQREGQAARRFRHPNAVIVYDMRANPDGLTYMVMEYVDGHTLDKELQQRGHFTPHEALEVLEPVARALDVAHTHGVIHRDLKPENVMLNRDDAGRLQIKLLDLGIAKLRGIADAVAGGDDSAGLTVAGQILGTPYYMSPEQWGARQRDGNTDIDGRTDIYSLGIIFYELCAGHKPFIGGSLPEMQQAHLTEVPRPLNEVWPEVPVAFARAVAHAMAKERDERPATVAEFADELRVALEMTVEPRAATTLSSLAVAAPPPPQVPAAQTAAQERARNTNAPVQAEAQTVNQATGNATKQAGALSGNTSPAAIAPTIATSATPAALWPSVSGVPAASAPVGVASLVEPVVAPPVKGRSAAPLIAGVVGLVLLVCAAAGGWFVWQRMSAPGAPVVANGNANVGQNTNANGALAAPVEALSYWIEAFDTAGQVAGQRVANDGAISLRSTQQFRFHFSPRERGYIYVIGPGPRGNAPMTFLTARPTVGLLKTNQVAAGADFSFPYGAGAVFQLDRNPGTEEYTVIYSPSPLLTPAFLAAPAEHELTPAEQSELETLRAGAQTGTAALRVQDTSGAPPAVAVNVPGTGNTGQPVGKSGQPVFFEIRIEHK